jgi:hypothetical protein
MSNLYKFINFFIFETRHILKKNHIVFFKEIFTPLILEMSVYILIQYIILHPDGNKTKKCKIIIFIT